MIITANKRAYFDYRILERYEAGIELRGFEVKAAKSGRINLSGSYVIIRGAQAWLINADIPPYQPLNTPADYNQKRTRRLLLKKEELKKITSQVQEGGLTLVPLKVYTKGASGKIKIEIGLGKAKEKADKREAIKRRDIEREIARNL